jgi:hypothetical protein
MPATASLTSFVALVIAAPPNVIRAALFSYGLPATPAT